MVVFDRVRESLLKAASREVVRTTGDCHIRWINIGAFGFSSTTLLPIALL
ncbi:MAG: hypothetical protein ACLSA6_18225 [Holdemania massiliensis]